MVLPTTPSAGQTKSMTIVSLQQAQVTLAMDRDWEQFHTLRNLILALVGEVGEFAEVLQWEGGIGPSFLADSPVKQFAFKEEIA